MSQTVTMSASIKDAIIKEVPVTLKQPPPADLEKVIPNPGMPRANKAISREKPEGSPNTPDREHMTTLQQHVAWFDFDGDGIIYPWDTFRGFYKIGFNRFMSSIAMMVIHNAFSIPTWHAWFSPRNLLMPIHIDRLHRSKHGSDSEVYDTEGRFVPQKFEEIFSKFDHGNKGALSWSDIQDMVYANMNCNDPNGWIAERLEWWTTWWLCKDARGLLPKEAVRGIYDGTMYDVLAAQTVERRKTATYTKPGKNTMGMWASDGTGKKVK